jgi:hypothetical protein
MALAILDLVAFEKSGVRFSIDTGTNRYYKVKLGRSAQQNYGIGLVDEVYYTSPVGTNAAGGSLLNSSKEITIPLNRFDKGIAYVQLFSFKSPDGKSPAFSSILKLPMGIGLPVSALPRNLRLAPAFSAAAMLNTVDTFQPTRKVTCRTASEAYSTQASWEDILGGIAKVAMPLLQNLLGGAKDSGGSANGGSNNQPGTPTPPGAPALPGGEALPGLLTQLIGTLLKSLGGPQVSQTQSLYEPVGYDNRFFDPTVLDGHYGPNGHRRHPHRYHRDAYLENRFMLAQAPELARPFIFGIDDALLGTLVSAVAGPFIKVLPELLNSVNKQRLEMKQENNKFTSGILAGINQRLLLQQLQNAQQSAQANNQPGAAELAQLIQSLQSTQAAPAGGSPAPAAGSQSLSLSGAMAAQETAVLSSKGVVSFVTTDAVIWNGMPKTLFAHGQDIQFRVRLDVAGPAPKSPLPKAIFKFAFKGGQDQALIYEKVFKQKGVSANTTLPFAFTAGELAHLPVNQPVSVLVEMRWLAPTSGNEYKALGSAETVFINHYFLKEQGEAQTVEQELTDMKRFRPFWNKVWEAPVLDAADGRSQGEKKYTWELDVNGKYSMLLAPDHDSNGLMETRLIQGKPDPESVVAKTEGRMKAGIELSLVELNKLLPLWDNAAPLDPEHLEAFKTDAFARNNASEFIYNFKLKGRSGQRGMIYVVPVFKLFNFTLGAVKKTEETGQVSAVSDEKVAFPLPVSARLLGLKSK